MVRVTASLRVRFNFSFRDRNRDRDRDRVTVRVSDRIRASVVRVWFRVGVRMTQQ